jgi:hypothetical protein
MPNPKLNRTALRRKTEELEKGPVEINFTEATFADLKALRATLEQSTILPGQTLLPGELEQRKIDGEKYIELKKKMISEFIAALFDIMENMQLWRDKQTVLVEHYRERIPIKLINVLIAKCKNEIKLNSVKTNSFDVEYIEGLLKQYIRE